MHQDLNSVTTELKDFLLAQNVPVFGTASAATLEDLFPESAASRMLAAAKSVMCLGVPIPRGIFRSETEPEAMYWRAANVFYRHIDALSMRAAAVVEEHGEAAVSVFGCFPYKVLGRGDFKGYINLMKLGETVGIGKMGKNGLLFNATYGPRLLLSAIVTTAELNTMSWPRKETTGCPAGCAVCVEQCPAQAINADGRVNTAACAQRSIRSPVFSYFMKATQPSEQDVEMLTHVTAVDDHAWYRCIKCVSACPQL